MKSVKILIVFLIFSCYCLAHEVPPMTKHELAEKNAARSRLKQAKIKSISRWKFVIENGAATDKKEKTLQQNYDQYGNPVGIKRFNRDNKLIGYTKMTFESF